MSGRKIPQDQLQTNAMLNHVLGPQRSWMQFPASEVSAVEHPQVRRPIATTSAAAPSNTQPLPLTSNTVEAGLPVPQNDAAMATTESSPASTVTAPAMTSEQPAQPLTGSSTQEEPGHVDRGSTRGLPARGRPRGRPRGSRKQMPQLLHQHQPTSHVTYTPTSWNNVHTSTEDNHNMNRQTHMEAQMEAQAQAQAQRQDCAQAQRQAQPRAHQLARDQAQAYTQAQAQARAQQFPSQLLDVGNNTQFPSPCLPSTGNVAPNGHPRWSHPSLYPVPAAATATMVPSSQEIWRSHSMYAPRGFQGKTAVPHGPGRSWYQAHLDLRVLLGVPGVRWLQYFAQLAMEPLLLRDDSWTQGDLMLSEDEHAMLLKDSYLPDGSKCWMKNDSEKSIQYYFNCVRKPCGQTVDDSMWVQPTTSWPQTLTIRCNERFVDLKRKFHWQLDQPANITDYLEVGRNALQIGYLRTPGVTDVWYFVVQKSILASQDDIRSEIIQQEESIEATGQRLQSLFASSDPDIEILTETVSLNIRDPLSSELIGCPVRSVACEHLECFDLDTYLSSRPSVGVTSWRCPICNHPARPPDLVFVPWMENILQSLKNAEKDAQTLLVQRDGTWEAKPLEAKSQDAGTGERDEQKHVEPDASSAGYTVIELD